MNPYIHDVFLCSLGSSGASVIRGARAVVASGCWGCGLTAVTRYRPPRTFSELVDKLANRIEVERALCNSLTAKMVLAIFNFQSMLLVCLLLIVTCTLLKNSSVPILPGLINANKTGFASIFYKFTVIGERLSPYVAIACIIMAIQTMFLD